MKEIDISKHTKESLEFVFTEATKLSDNVLLSISKNTQKSYILAALLASIFSYSFTKIDTKIEMFILIVGSSVSLMILYRNIFPKKTSFNGSLPEDLLSDYFNNFKEDDLAKEYLATQIESINDCISDNMVLVPKMTERFKSSVYAMLFFFFLFLLYLFFRL